MVSSAYKIIRRVLLMAVLFMLSSCYEKLKVEDVITRTVIVYIAADNNLTTNANPNIYSMSSSMTNGMDDLNLIVFVDQKNIKPSLLRVHDHKIDTIMTYPEMDSTDPAVLGEVIDYVINEYDSESYGLILWSHGQGWLPTSQLHFVAPNLNYVQSRSKAFAWEDDYKNNPPYRCMDIEEMASVIPDGLFDFIVFDACYMGCVEVAYALRNKADYIVSSCYEIVSYGFPYHIVTKDFLNGNLLKACREYHTYYNKMTSWEQMAGISLVKTDGLDSLARCFGKIVAGFQDSIPRMDVSNVQCFDRYRNHVFFDLEDMVDKLGPSEKYLTEFRLQLEKCIPYKISTPYIFPGDREQIKVNSYCGLSVYVPLSSYDASGLNADYRKTEWSIDTGY